MTEQAQLAIETIKAEAAQLGMSFVNTEEMPDGGAIITFYFMRSYRKVIVDPNGERQ